MELLPFGAEASRSQLIHYNMSGCPSLYGFMGILWNGDLITCCMDWTRARVMGNAREDSLYALWHNPRYRGMRQLSDEGRLDEEPLCRDCGDNRFSIDSGVLARYAGPAGRSRRTGGDRVDRGSPPRESRTDPAWINAELTMRVLLLNMPFVSVSRPSIGLSLLKARLAEEGIECVIGVPDDIPGGADRPRDLHAGR